MSAARSRRPPFEWPLREYCGQDVDRHGLGNYTAAGYRRPTLHRARQALAGLVLDLFVLRVVAISRNRWSMGLTFCPSSEARKAWEGLGQSSLLSPLRCGTPFGRQTSPASARAPDHGSGASGGPGPAICVICADLRPIFRRSQGGG